MHSMTFKTLALATVLCAAVPAAQAGDAPGCSDPAMFPSRIPHYEIASCTRANDAQEFRWPGGTQQVLGVRTEVNYRVASVADGATPKYIAANYANAIRRIGGKLLQDPAKSSLGDRVTARIPLEGGGEAWVHLTSDHAVVGGHWSTYKLILVAPDAAAQVITAQKMLDELDKAGFIALYIPFDSGKWDLKPESRGLVGEIVALMRGRPGLKVSIEGHTDNVGAPAANQSLSTRRAQAVMEAVVAQGIDPARLRSVGHGQDRPVADNRSEEGRAKNRRVELVRQ